MRAITLIAAALVVSGPAARAGETDAPAPQARKLPPGVECREVEDFTTRIRKKREICATEKAWERQAQQGRDYLNSSRNLTGQPAAEGSQ